MADIRLDAIQFIEALELHFSELPTEKEATSRGKVGCAVKFQACVQNQACNSITLLKGLHFLWMHIHQNILTNEYLKEEYKLGWCQEYNNILSFCKAYRMPNSTSKFEEVDFLEGFK